MEEEEKSHVFCNNCRKYGHVFNKCKMPVVSYGVILFKNGPKGIEYLMICRRNTLGYIDFLRGKYSVNHKYYIMNMLKQMTCKEIHQLETQSFDELWLNLWNEISKDDTEPTVAYSAAYNNQYKIEENSSRLKFQLLSQGVYCSIHNHDTECFTLKSMIAELKAKQPLWEEPEWGFPKGRRNYQESEYHCALREFVEETGISTEKMIPIRNIFPVEENFIGSNYKSYKHKYFLLHWQGTDSECEFNDESYSSEVSKRAWYNLEECLSKIRHYNVEKKKILQNVHQALLKYFILCKDTL